MGELRQVECVREWAPLAGGTTGRGRGRSGGEQDGRPQRGGGGRETGLEEAVAPRSIHVVQEGRQRKG